MENREARDQLTSASGNENLLPFTKEIPNWLDAELTEKWDKTNLEYDYYLKKLTELEAAKRDKIPQETARVWYQQFLRNNWTKYMFDRQFNALMKAETSGHAIRIDDWFRADAGIPKNPDAYKPPPKYLELTEEDKKSTAKILRKTIEQMDAKMNLNRQKPKKNYPELPPNWKSETMDKFRRGDRIKKENRERQ